MGGMPADVEPPEEVLPVAGGEPDGCDGCDEPDGACEPLGGEPLGGEPDDDGIEGDDGGEVGAVCGMLAQPASKPTSAPQSHSRVGSGRCRDLRVTPLR